MSLVDKFVAKMPVKDRARNYPFHVDVRLKIQHCDQSSSEVCGEQAPWSRLFYHNLCIGVQFDLKAAQKWSINS